MGGARANRHMLSDCRWLAIYIVAVVLVVPTSSFAQQSFYPQRSQTFLMSQSDAHAKGRDAFTSIKAAAMSRGALVTEGELYDRISTITGRLIKAVPEMRPDAESWGWEVILITDPTPNAFTLPGGKVVVYSGLIENLELTDDETAAVLGHEMSHALREHGREKAGQKMAANIAVGALAILAGAYGVRHNSSNPSALMNATATLGSLGAAALFLLPNSREMEIEADRMGVELAAMAGYDPNAAITLWQKMEARGSNVQGDFLSTHPAPSTRISEVTAESVTASQLFGSRHIVSTAAAPRLKPKVTDSVVCSLPSGHIEALAPLACVRVGGTLKAIEKNSESKVEEKIQ